MKFHFLTLFPEMIESGLNTSIIGRAVKAGFISIHTVHIRDYTEDKHGHTDAAPYGGGAGLVMTCQPIYDAYRDVLAGIAADKVNAFARSKNLSFEEAIMDPEFQMMNHKKPRVLYTSPAGRVFDQEMAKELSKEEDLIILCGHYEGVDQRVLDLIEAEEVSIGDYVLTGGELPAMVMADAISRMVPGVLHNEDSGVDESFSDVYPKQELTKKARKEVYGELLRQKPKVESEETSQENEIEEELKLKLLEYPQYTRPEVFMGMKVPEILLSGNHAEILKWRRSQSIERTKKRRPDLL